MIPNNVALLAEMLEVLVLALSVMEEEATAFGLHINWSKTKIVQFCNPATCSTVQVADGQVEVVDSFVVWIKVKGKGKGKGVYLI